MRRVLSVFALIALLSFAIPTAVTLDYLGTCHLDPGWSHEDGVRVPPLFPDQAQVGTPFVVPDTGGRFLMAYAAGNGSWSGIYGASSPDGINWTHGTSPVVKAVEFGLANILEPFTVLLPNGTAYMYLEGWDVFQTSPPLGHLYRATSLNGGATWTANGPILNGSVGQLFPASPVVEHDDSAGIFRMYYTGLNTTFNRRAMFLATSTDGVAWVKQGMVMPPGGPAQGGVSDVNGPMRIGMTRERGPIANRLYYSEYRKEDKIFTAISGDGLGWVKDRVVLTKGPTDENNMNISAPTVITSGWGEARMYFMADGEAGPVFQIFSARTHTINDDPQPDAGPLQEVPVATWVTVNGSASFDRNPDDAINTTWVLVGRPPNSTTTLLDPWTLTTTFYADWPGTYTLILVMVDDCGGIGFAFTAVTAVNEAPAAVASAWPGTSLPVGSAALVDGGNSTDLEGGPLTASWSILSQPLGSTLTLANASAPRQQFVLDAIGDFTFSLTMTDPYGATGDDSVTLTAINRAPLPSITVSPSALVVSGTAVTFDASGSTDPDGHALSFSWNLTSSPAGSTTTLTAATGATTGLTPDLAGVYVAMVTADDPWGGTGSFPAVLVATNSAPATVILLSPASTVQLNTTATLDASGTFDPDGHGYSLAWSLLTTPVGSTATLSNVTGPLTDLTPDVEGTYTIQLTATDDYGATSLGFAAVTGVASPPFADAGTDLGVLVGTTVVLDGSGSVSPSGQPLLFAWDFLLVPGGSSSFLVNSSATIADFVPDRVGSYIVELFVVDPASGLNSTDAVVITATNDPPIVTACCDAVFDLGTSASVTANSSDPDPGHAVTHLWDFLARPSGSTATFADPTAASTSFTVDSVGAYLARVTATDPYGATSSAIVTIQSNRPPRTLALVLPDDLVLIGTTVTLDGRNSYDPDGDPITLAWTLDDWPGMSGGSPAPVTRSSPGVLEVDATYLGVFQATLAANDTYGSTATLAVNFSSFNSPPLALAVCDAAVSLGRLVTCTAAGSVDPDPGHTAGLAFSWAVLSTPVGAAVSFSDPNATITTVSMDRVGDYTLSLTATDVWGGTETDALVVAITNAAPVADAGVDRLIVLEVQSVRVTLDGTRSVDPDGHAILFSWAVSPSGLPATLSNPGTAAPSFNASAPGRYVFEVTVTDEHGLFRTDQVNVTVNRAPSARAGLDRDVLVGESYGLDASGSFDADGGIASYEWQVTSQPADSEYQLTDNRTASATFLADTPGTYELTLRVVDDLGAVSYDRVVLTVSHPPDLVTPIALSLLGVALAGLVVYQFVRRRRVLIEDLFLLGRDAILIKHYTRRLRPGSDADILSAMLVAVQNFVDDSFKKMDAHAKPLEQFKFGDQTMLISKGEHLFLAALVSGPNPQKVLTKISQTVEILEKEMGDVFAAWDGNMKTMGGADRYINELLGIRQEK